MLYFYCFSRCLTFNALKRVYTLDMITWTVCPGLKMASHYTNKSHPYGHICLPNPRCSEGIPTEVGLQQKCTRESLKFPDEVIPGCIFGQLDVLGAGIILFFSYSHICTSTQVFKMKANQRKGTIIWTFRSRFAPHLLHLPGECLFTLPCTKETWKY